MREVDGKPSAGKRGTLRRAMVLVGGCAMALALLVLIDVALTIALVPYGGQSEAIWYQYGEMSDESIDTVIVGTSYAKDGINPMVLDGVMGTSSFSLATPNQSPSATLVALRNAYEQHGVRRAILGMSVGNLSNPGFELAYRVAFTLGEMRCVGLGTAVADYARMTFDDQFFGDANSLAALAPWTTYNDGFSLEAIRSHMENRKGLTPVEVMNQSDIPLLGRGFQPVAGHMDDVNVAARVKVAGDEEYEMDGHVVEQYLAICDYCKERGIELSFVFTPLPDYSVVRFEKAGGYASLVDGFSKLVEQRGARCLDYTFVRPETYAVEERDFFEETHLNRQGADRFTSVLAETLLASEAGEELSGLFYPHTTEGWNERLADIDGIEMTTYWNDVQSGEVNVRMKAFAGPSAVVEFQLERRLEDGNYVVLRPFGRSDNASVPTDGHGTMILRVRSRELGGESAGYQTQCEREVLY